MTDIPDAAPSLRAPALLLGAMAVQAARPATRQRRHAEVPHPAAHRKSREGQRPVGRPAAQPPWQQLCRHACKKLNAISEMLATRQLRRSPCLHGERRSSARSTSPSNFDHPARALLRRHRRGPDPAVGHARRRPICPRLRQPRPLEGGVRPPTAKALAGGSGWVILAHSPRDKRLFIHWAARSLDGAGRRCPAARAGHVRACLCASTMAPMPRNTSTPTCRPSSWTNAERLYREAMRVVTGRVGP